jgi:hypothetical protein
LKGRGCKVTVAGNRTLRSPRDDPHWYHANNPGDKVTRGFGDEEAIRAIWASDP